MPTAIRTALMLRPNLENLSTEVDDDASTTEVDALPEPVFEDAPAHPKRHTGA